jgi:hypothetical protein
MRPAASLWRLRSMFRGLWMASEYVQQMNGVVEALSDREVQAVLFATPEVPVNLAIFEWSASSISRSS